MTRRLLTTRRSAAILIGLLAASLPAAGSAASRPVPSYTVTVLDALGQDGARALDLDDRGLVVGYGDRQAYAETGPWSLRLESPAGQPSKAYAVSRGRTVGSVGTAPAVWDREGGLTTLPGTGAAYGVNSHGTVAGATTAADGRITATSWDSRLRPRALPFLEDKERAESRAWDVAEDGTVIGSSTHFEAHTDHFHRRQHAVVWNGGAPEDLGALWDDGVSIAYAVTGRHIVGEANEEDGSYDAVRFTDDGIVKLPDVRAFKFQRANDVTRSGVVVGTASSTLGAGDGVAALWSHGRGYDLNRLASGLPEGWVLRAAEAVNQRGQIAGWATDAEGHSFAVLLTPAR